MSFLDERYLLESPVAEEIYSSIQALPIIDAHNHCDVKALSEDRNFTDIWDAEAATDHYVWECFRKVGVPEEYLTGKNHSNYEKWMAIAKVFWKIAGNPTYEWIHLDLKRRFGIDAVIGEDTAQMIWDKTKEMLAKPEMSQQALIRAMNVETMCSTDDPVDTLEYHKALASSSIAGRVRPTFRPDKAMNIFKPEWPDYIEKLEKRWNTQFKCIHCLLGTLRDAHDFFAEMGCCASDHGVNVPWSYQVSADDANAVFQKARSRKPLTQDEIITYISFFINEMAELDAEKNWVFQYHIGAERDIRDSLYKALGPDVGGDTGNVETSYLKPMLPLLNRFDGRLKVVLYNMVPEHTGTLAQLTRAFGEKVSLGSAWWLNDSFIGMKRQLEYIGSVDVLANMAGMVSDSRKIMSYSSRHEMFRRTLSTALGAMAERGQMPKEVAIKLAAELAYSRPKALFGFK